MRRLFCLTICILIFSACDSAETGQSAPATETARSVGYVDSIFPMDEAIRRFREGLAEVTRLEGGASSRGQLVRDFIRAVEANDTSAVRGMLVSRAEYAYLYFPTSIYMNKPYQQSPSLAWFLNTQNSEKGIIRVMQRLGGHDLKFEKYSCSDEIREARNRFWRSCTSVYQDPQEQRLVTRRLFGTIIERGGRYKFLSYANDF